MPVMTPAAVEEAAYEATFQYEDAPMVMLINTDEEIRPAITMLARAYNFTIVIDMNVPTDKYFFVPAEKYAKLLSKTRAMYIEELGIK